MSIEETKETQDTSRKDFVKYKPSTDYLSSLIQKDLISHRDKQIIEKNLDKMIRMNPVIISIIYKIAIQSNLDDYSSIEEFETEVEYAFNEIQKGDELDFKISFILKENYDSNSLLRLKSQMMIYWEKIKMNLFISN